MIVAIMTTALSGTAWAEDFTLSSANEVTQNGITISFAKGSGGTAPAWYSAGLRLYASNTITISSSNTITGITFNWEKQGSKAFASATANVGTYSHPTAAGTGTWTGSANEVVFTIGSSGQLQLNTLSVTVSSGGSVTPTCATPTFSPVAGAVVSGTEVTISSTEGATIYYTTNGTTPTTSSSVYSAPIEITAATTIKAFATKTDYNNSEVATAAYTIKPIVSGYTIDFENDVDAYVDWNTSNIGIHTTGVTSAHGGSAWGSNVNSNDNATTTAYIQTKEKVAYPNVFTCYISKESSNSTASSWKIQVSSDGSSWTDIATLSSMTQNTWTEFTGDIKAAGHTNVYVRLYYSGSNAKRAVDDISLTTYTPAAVEEPVISVTTPFTFSTTATITCVTEGATIYYSYDNSTWTEYTEGLPITSTTTIYAKAVKGDDESTVAQVTATKELATPTVEISAISFNIGETATVTTDGPAVTLTTSAAGVASVSGTTVTGVAAGTATITATWAADADYSAGSEEFVVTVVDPNAPGSVNNPYTVAQALAVIDGLANGAKTDNEVYVAGTITQIDEVSTQYHNATYWISNDGGTTKLEVFHGKYLNNANFTSSEQIKVNDQVVVYGKLQKYVKDATTTPEIAQGNYIYSLVRAKQDPTIPNTPVDVVYGNTYTVSGIVGGDATLTSSNTSVATVSELVITPVAVGAVTITVETAENDTYKAGRETFTLTVNRPDGETTAPTGSAGAVLFNETFDNFTGTGYTGGHDGEYTGSVGTGSTTTNKPDEEGWEDMSNYGADQCLKLGTGSAYKAVTTRSIALTGNGTLTFSAAGWGDSNANQLNVTASGATLSGDIDITLTNGAWDDYTVNITNGNGNVQITFSMKRGFLDDVKVEAPATPAPTETYTIPASGLGTYCSQYPIDLDELPEGVKAYAVTAKGESSVTLTEITGIIKGGVGFILEGSGEVTFTFADSSTEPTNLLVGTLAPEYLAEGTAYGLKSGVFQPNTVGTIKAHRAYLPADAGNAVKALTLIFEDDATGITHTRVITDEATIYDLTGRRLSQMQKGINIVNGKKILK